MSEIDAAAYPPPSEDDAVQDFIDTQWREAVVAAERGREIVRTLWPDLAVIMTETGSTHLRSALDSFERALRDLHLAGRHAIGAEAYAEHVIERTRAQAGKLDQ